MPFALETQNLHPSTLLCLEALQNMPADFTMVRGIDLGCGNGILSIVAANIWPEARIEAVDISPNAVKDAKEAVTAQGLADRVDVHHNDVFRHLKGRSRHENGLFDAAISNLLVNILIPLSPHLKENIRPGGYAILSGILAWQAADIEAIYTGLDFDIIKKYEDSPWVAYMLCHKTDT